MVSLDTLSGVCTKNLKTKVSFSVAVSLRYPCQGSENVISPLLAEKDGIWKDKVSPPEESVTGSWLIRARMDQKVPLLSALPAVNLNAALIESLTWTVVLMDSSLREGLPELFLLQLTTTIVAVINKADKAGIRREPGFMMLI